MTQDIIVVLEEAEPDINVTIHETTPQEVTVSELTPQNVEIVISEITPQEVTVSETIPQNMDVIISEIGHPGIPGPPGPPGPPGVDTVEALSFHVDSPLPHPIYDDGPSLFLLYQNAKV